MPKFNSIITALGGTVGTYTGSTGIYVNYVGVSSDDATTSAYGGSSPTSTTNTIGANSVNGYDSTYDAIIYGTNSTPPNTNINTAFSSYYYNNKGVVMTYVGLAYNNTNVIPPKIITSSNDIYLTN